MDDIRPLTGRVQAGIAALRDGDLPRARALLGEARKADPGDSVAAKAAIEAALEPKALDDFVLGARRALAGLTATTAAERRAAACAHFTLGSAVLTQAYNTGIPPWERPRDVPMEAGRELRAAVDLDPSDVVARLGLAAYYEHRAVHKGSKARREYERVLALRPDLWRVRYLHAVSWDRPNYVLNEAELRKRGIVLADDDKRRSDRAVAELLALVRDHPDYAPAYKRLAEDYQWPLGQSALALKYARAYLRRIPASAPDRGEMDRFAERLARDKR